MKFAANPNYPSFLEERFPLDWQMTRAEKYALIELLSIAKPKVAVEVGTYRGGSLQVLCTYAEKVYSVDIDPDVATRLQGRFRNVEFRTGHSKDVLGSVLEEIRENREVLGFVLIDGDHSAEGVCRDINCFLEHPVEHPFYLVCHDSFNPDCRAGMLNVDWKKCRHVKYVEIDFIPGVFHSQAFDTATADSMWGGFALASLVPEEREEELTIYESYRAIFEAVFRLSCHASRPRRRSLDLSQIVSNFRAKFYNNVQ